MQSSIPVAIETGVDHCYYLGALFRRFELKDLISPPPNLGGDKFTSLYITTEENGLFHVFQSPSGLWVIKERKSGRHEVMNRDELLQCKLKVGDTMMFEEILVEKITALIAVDTDTIRPKPPGVKKTVDLDNHSADQIWG